MKRFLLAFLITAALLGLLAVPAFAEAPWKPVWRPALKTAYVIAYADGSWFEAVGEDLTLVGHWTVYDDNGNLVEPAPPIPADYDVVMQVSWKTLTYGLVKTFPLRYQLKVRIPEAGVDLSYEQAEAFWGTDVFIWDDYWVANLFPIPGFNPHIGAKVYANRWLPPLTGDKSIATKNLTADKKLAPGTYTVYFTENLVHTAAFLDIWFDGQKSPFIAHPEGENVVPPFTFTVAGP